MLRVLAPIAVLGLIASPALAATKTKPVKMHKTVKHAAAHPAAATGK